MVFTEPIGSTASWPLLRGSSDFRRNAERAALASRAARARRSRVDGNRDLSRLRVLGRNGDSRGQAIRCAIHMVPGIWLASGGLVGSPALAAENKLAEMNSGPAKIF
jgi:hypothetical protein